MKNMVLVIWMSAFLPACSKKDETAEFLKEQEKTQQEQRKKKAEAIQKYNMYLGEEEKTSSSEPEKSAKQQ